MKAIQMLRKNTLAFREIDVPQIRQPWQVLLRVTAAAIAASDVLMMHGLVQASEYPRVPGHEVAGVVEAVGMAVTRVRPGDRVVLEQILACGNCYACLSGRPNLCRYLRLTSVHCDGGFQEYMLADESQLYQIPEDMTPVRAALSNTYAEAIHAVSQGPIHHGDVVLIHGASAIGLVICELAKERGALVAISERNAVRRSKAIAFDADRVVDPEQESLTDCMAELTKGRGPNVIFDCAGIPSLMGLSVEMAASGGTIVSLGLNVRSIPATFATVTRKELRIVGSYLQTNRFHEAIERISEAKNKVDRLVSGVFPFAQYREAIEFFADKNRNCGKTVLVWE